MSTYEKRQKKILMEEIVDCLIELEDLGYHAEEILDELAEKYVHPEEGDDISDLDIHMDDHEDDDDAPRDTLDSIIPPNENP
jgi:hypothetical protein